LTRPLFGRTSWARAKRILQKPDQPILIGLDLDGTLAPIMPRPDLVRVPAPTLRSIRRAARGRHVMIVILSARPAKDLKRLLPVRGVIRIGQYGLEGPLQPGSLVRARMRRRCARVTRALRPRVRAVRGAFLEPKGLTVAVHRRNVKGSPARRALSQAIRLVAAREARAQGFVPMPGAEIVDFVPRGHDKGRTLRALRARLRPAAVFYFGDSDGDEPAFVALDRGDFPVRVGRGGTRARFRVEGIQGVTRFLDAVTAWRAGPV
jgi:trehalose 6-phosphate phosphatase